MKIELNRCSENGKPKNGTFRDERNGMLNLNHSEKKTLLPTKGIIEKHIDFETE